MASLEDRLDRNPIEWRPAVGDRLVGTVTDIDTIATDYGESPLLIVETDDGDVYSVACWHTVLKREVAKREPQVGDRIGIKYFGVRDGQNYEYYKLVLERPSAPPNWKAMAAQAEAEHLSYGDDDREPDPDYDFGFGEE
jgi:hypothetical protein